MSESRSPQWIWRLCRFASASQRRTQWKTSAETLGDLVSFRAHFTIEWNFTMLPCLHFIWCDPIYISDSVGWREKTGHSENMTHWMDPEKWKQSQTQLYSLKLTTERNQLSLYLFDFLSLTHSLTPSLVFVCSLSREVKAKFHITSDKTKRTWDTLKNDYIARKNND